MEWRKINTIMVLVFIIIILGSYLGYDKYKENYDKGYQQGVRDGIDTTMFQIGEMASGCQIITLRIGNESLALVDVSCVP